MFRKYQGENCKDGKHIPLHSTVCLSDGHLSSSALGGGISRDAQLGLGTSNLLFLSWYVCMKFSKEKNPPNKINNSNSSNTSKDTRPW